MSLTHPLPTIRPPVLTQHFHLLECSAGCAWTQPAWAPAFTLLLEASCLLACWAVSPPPAPISLLRRRIPGSVPFFKKQIQKWGWAELTRRQRRPQPLCFDEIRAVEPHHYRHVGGRGGCPVPCGSSAASLASSR